MTDATPELAERPGADSLLIAVDLLRPVFEESGLDELEVEVGELRVRLARPRAPAAAVSASPLTGSATAAGAPAPAPQPFGAPAAGMRFVSAPLTGLWYASPSPGARAYVQEGDELATGQVVGLIEAMKLFNEIKSDIGGTVTRILVENGTLVKRQQPLLEVDPR